MKTFVGVCKSRKWFGQCGKLSILGSSICHRLTWLIKMVVELIGMAAEHKQCDKLRESMSSSFCFCDIWVGRQKLFPLGLCCD